MSLRLEMLQVARLAPKVLGESAELVRDFLLRQQNDDGGFGDRAGQSDLYYTVFGLDSLLALRAEIPIDQTRVFCNNLVLAKAWTWCTFVVWRVVGRRWRI